MSRRRSLRGIHQRAPYRRTRQPPVKKSIADSNEAATRSKRLPRHTNTRPKVVPVLRKHARRTGRTERRVQRRIRLLRQWQQLVFITQPGIHGKPSLHVPIILQKPCPLLRVKRSRRLSKALREGTKAEVVHRRDNRRTPAVRV